MEKQVSCGIIPILYKDNKKWFLILKWRHNNWWFPKWHMEEWEDCLTTALREFTEETGIPSNFIDVIDKKRIYEDSYWFTLEGRRVFKIVRYYVWFLKEWFEKYIKPQNEEIYDIKIISLDDIKDYIKFNWLLKIISDIKDKV